MYRGKSLYIVAIFVTVILLVNLAVEVVAPEQPIISGLQNPYILKCDNLREQVYFVETNGTVYTLKRFSISNPSNIEVVTVSAEYIADVGLDIFGNVYTLEGGNKVYRINAATGVKRLLYTAPQNYWISEMDVDYFGVVVLAITNSSLGYHSGPLYEVRVFALLPPTYTFILPIAVFHLNDPIYVGSIQTRFLAVFGTVFVLNNMVGGDSIYRYMFGRLTKVLTKPGVNNGTIAYLHLRDGDLYYVYRQRSSIPSSSPWGYVEVGVVSNIFSRRYRVTTLYRASFSDVGILVFSVGASNTFFYMMSNMTPIINLVYAYPDGSYTVNIIKFLPNNEISVLHSDPSNEFLHFVVCRDRVIYFSRMASGEIWMLY